MSFDTLSLSMGELSEVKVENFNEVLLEAEQALKNYRLSDQNRQLIAETLNRIKETDDYGVTPDMVSEIDDTIRDVALYAVDDDGSVVPVVIEGTEQFSFTLTPAQWKQSRIEGCEALLGDLAKSITRWAKQAKDAIQELWGKFTYNIDVLNSGLKTIDGRLAEIEGESPTQSTLVVPKRLCKALAGSKDESVSAPRADDRIRNDVLYIFTVIKVWQLESTDFKNRLIRFFGNPEKYPYTFLKRKHPAFFSKKMFHDEHVMDIVYWSPPFRFIGNGGITFSEHNGKVESLGDLSHTLEESGYGTIQSDKTTFFKSPYQDTPMDVLSTSKLDKLYQIVVKIISILETLAARDGSFILSEKDVKDIITTLSNGKEEYNQFATSFGRIATGYQENVFHTQTGLFTYLFNLAGYLIEFISLHIEAYDGA